jgi:glutamate/aspartate transport system permease protein
MLSLDLSFYNWALFTDYIQKGLLFSVQLTVIATLGGIIFGTFLALMRLSGNPILSSCAS